MPGVVRRLRSWLHVSDHPSWHDKPSYSFSLARALTIAYDQLHHAHERPDPYFITFAVLAPFRDQIVCLQQRLNLEFALALAFTGDDSTPQAVTCLSSAWESGERLQDWGALAEVGYLAGALWHGESRLADAYSIYQDALDMLRRLAHGIQPVDPTFELDLVLRLAACALDLGWFSTSLRHVEDAYRVRAEWAPEAAEQAASLVWIDGQLARVHGQPVRALQEAAAAADLLLTYGRLINRGRAHTVLAESALDLLEALRSPTANQDLWRLPPTMANGGPLSLDGLLLQAQSAARLALETAQDVHDTIGVTLSRLILRRATRVSNPHSATAGNVAAVEKLLRTAKKVGDPALLGRVEMALADELLISGSPEAARHTYERARRRLEEYQLDGVAFWPRRALRQLDDSSH